MEHLKIILPSRFFEVIENAGIATAKQIIVLSFWDIKKLTNLKDDDIALLKNIVTGHCSPICITGMQIEKNSPRIKTGCRSIDKILRGGFRRGTLTELYGESGMGKTQIAMQAAAHCSSEGSVMICTEDLFPVKRFNQIAHKISPKTLSTDHGKNMFVEHLTESHDLLSCIRVRLPKLLSTNNTSLIIIDSVAAPFRTEYNNYIQRAEELKELAILLLGIAQKHNLAILCINQVTASMDHSDVLPSLGLAWSNMVSTRIKLSKTDELCYNKVSHQNISLRELTVIYSPDLPNAMAKFIITESGIEDIEVVK